jgi:hypothetical protein
MTAFICSPRVATEFLLISPEVAGASIPRVGHCEIAARLAPANLLEKGRIVGFTQSHRRLSVADIGSTLLKERSGSHISHTE